MKNTVFYAAVLLFATLMIAALPTDAEGEIYSDTIRLHILAESDSEDINIHAFPCSFWLA